MIFKLVSITLLIIFICGIAYSQNDSLKIFTVSQFRLLLNEKYKDVLYEFADTSNKVLITPDSIKINSNSYHFGEAITNLKEVGFERIGTFWQGMLPGAITGFAIGLIFGGFYNLDPHPTNIHWDPRVAAIMAVLLAVPSSLIGGIVSIFTTHYEYEKFTGNTTGTKRYKLIKAIREGRNN